MLAYSTAIVHQELCQKIQLSIHTQPEIFLVLGVAYKQISNPKCKLYISTLVPVCKGPFCKGFLFPMLCKVYAITSNILMKDFGGLLQSRIQAICKVEALEVLNFRETQAV